MKSGWYERKGPAREVITVGEMQAPEPGPGELRVRLYASGVNPTDCKRRAGLGDEDWGYYEHFPDYPRIVPNNDGAGVVDALGPGVDATRLGERVWVYNARYRRAFGTAAEYVALSAEQAAPLPEALTFAQGACLGIPAMTAHRCLFADGPIDGQTVLVAGGAGRVAGYAIQLAKWGGATVVTTVSSDAKAAKARELGPDHVIHYLEEDVVARVAELTGGEGLDRVVEVNFGVNIEADMKMLKSNGVVSAYASMGGREPQLPFYALMLKNAALRLVMVHGMPLEARRRACRDIGSALVEHELLHPIARRFPLTELAAAHEAVESGALTGNVVVEID